MLDENEYYCQIFVNAETLTEKDLLEFIAKYRIKDKYIRTIETEDYVLDVIRNDSYIDRKKNKTHSDFLFYKFFLDINPTENVTRNQYINSIKGLISYLNEGGYGCVAACNFEDELK